MPAGFHPRGVYSLEGDWSGDPKRRLSIEPMLAIIDQHFTDTPAHRHIHYDVATPGELEFYLKQWTRPRFQSHPILYIAFHGQVGELRLNANDSVSLDRLEELLAGHCHRRIIHFAACNMLGVHGNRLNRFLANTGALAVSGYECEIDWILSAAFELVLLSKLQFGPLRRSGLPRFEQRVREASAGLSQRLCWRMWY